MTRFKARKHSAAAGALIARAATTTESPDHIEAVEAAEKAKEREARVAQKHIEHLADNGMDGPRPCMHNGGKRM
ncbi:hypothetical protein FOA52_012051 [Chlamydomonas sp. UWO 241]|nr:hypothetical protein FOA52_012051 [Chlamydomonas sp. UWO 241]